MVVDRLAVKASAKRRLTDSVETALGPGRRAGAARLRRPARGRPAPRAHVLRAPGLPQRRTRRHRGARAAVVLVQLAVRRLPGVHRPRHPDGGRPRAGRPRPGAQSLRRGRDPAVGRRRTSPTTSCGCSSALGERARLRPRHPVGASCRPRRRRRSSTGTPTKVHVRYQQPVRPRALLLRRVRGRRSRTSSAGTREAESDTSREQFEGYMREVPCPACGGRPAQAGCRSRSRIGGKNIAEVCALSIGEARGVPARTLDLTAAGAADRRAGAQGDPRPAAASCSTSASTTSPWTGRPATLSGGEAQRIRLATQIGSGLVGVLYVLDEPSIGLHQRDNHRLIETLVRLQGPRQHADRGRARRGHHPDRRLGGRHRPGRRRARRPDRRTPARSRTCSTTRTR